MLCGMFKSSFGNPSSRRLLNILTAKTFPSFSEVIIPPMVLRESYRISFDRSCSIQQHNFEGLFGVSFSIISVSLTMMSFMI